MPEDARQVVDIRTEDFFVLVGIRAERLGDLSGIVRRQLFALDLFDEMRLQIRLIVELSQESPMFFREVAVRRTVRRRNNLLADRLRQVEEVEEVADRSFAEAQPLPHLAVRCLEPRFEQLDRVRLIERTQLFPLEVFDQLFRTLVGVVGWCFLAHDTRQLEKSGELRRTPPPLAGDYSETVDSGERRDRDRVEDTVLADTVRQSDKRAVVQRASRLLRVLDNPRYFDET